MIEVTAALAQALPAAPAAPAPVMRGAAPDAATRFAELMAAQDAPPAALSPVAQSIAGTYGTYPTRPATLGDQVLGGLQKVQGDFQGHVQAVGRMLEPGAPALGVPELLRLQLGMAQLAVQVEVVGKAIGRSTQNIDQLVRMQ
jgi:type III secretion protein I